MIRGGRPMKTRLQQAGLCLKGDRDLEVNISLAWNVLAQLGLPARYGGRAQDGPYEYVIIDPHTGEHLAAGRGASLEDSICDASIKAKTLITQARH